MEILTTSLNSLNVSKQKKTAIFLVILSFVTYSFFQFSGFQGYEDETYNRIVKNLETSEFKTARSGYAQTVLETPFVWKGQIIDKMFGVSHGKIAQLCALFYNPFITALSVGVFFLIAALFTDRRQSLWVSLVYAFGTMAFPYAGIGMEPTAVLFVLLSVYFLFKFGNTINSVIPAPAKGWSASGGKAGIQKKKYWILNSKNIYLILSGLFYFLLFFSKAYYFVTFPAFIVYLYVYQATKKFIKHCSLFFLPLIVIVPVYLAANKYNFGVYFGGQYKLSNELLGGENPVFGLYGLLLSFGKSIFIYSPALIISFLLFKHFYNKYKNEALFVLLYSLSLILFVASVHWWSDETWGPRYLLSLSAIGLIPLVMLRKEDFVRRYKLLVISILALSFLFQFLGVFARYDVFPYSFYEIYGETNYNVLASQEYQYIPQFAPYLINYQLLKNKILGRAEPLRYKIIYTPPMEMSAKERGKEVTKEIVYDNNKYQAHVLNFWWMNAPKVSPYYFLVFYGAVFMGLFWWGRKPFIS